LLRDPESLDLRAAVGVVHLAEEAEVADAVATPVLVLD
jgi:hypothetical protein